MVLTSRLVLSSALWQNLHSASVCRFLLRHGINLQQATTQVCRFSIVVYHKSCMIPIQMSHTSLSSILRGNSVQASDIPLATTSPSVYPMNMPTIPLPTLV